MTHVAIIVAYIAGLFAGIATTPVVTAARAVSYAAVGIVLLVVAGRLGRWAR